ncbi:hypothetical protein SNE40_012562 [Patella caerulea]|uniref:Cytochrome b-c1 complex subunit 6 n=1 Tax=Patella caerulea TaxID=87958 RepID=A0AAN8JP27_PATCE
MVTENKAVAGNNGEPEEEEEELVDPQETLKEKCSEKAECQPYKIKLDECTERVNSNPETSENCTQELMDFLHCVDHCVAHDLFKHIK